MVDERPRVVVVGDGQRPDPLPLEIVCGDGRCGRVEEELADRRCRLRPDAGEIFNLELRIEEVGGREVVLHQDRRELVPSGRRQGRASAVPQAGC